MSQPIEFGPGEQDPLGVPLTDPAQLLGIFRQAEKKPQDLCLGIEYEMFAQDLRGARPLQYEGETSITALFLHLVQTNAHSLNPFTPLYEEKSIVALTSPKATIALEPGGQIEIALKPYQNVLDVAKNLHDVTEQIELSARKLNIALFAMGVHPQAEQNAMAKVKKKRYGIMRQYMGRLSGLGLDMMNRSCAIQINLDFESEQDMAQKMKLAAHLVPFHALLCSNSPYLDGKPCLRASHRSYIWQKTDPQRTGIPKVIFDKNFGYQAWIDWVYDIPMYFIRRGKEYLDVSGSSFRQFMSTGLHGQHPTVRDFVDHMSTAFTEVRLKPFIELRTPDSTPLCYLNAYVAMAWAHFYHPATFAQAAAFFADVSHQELLELHDQVINVGKDAIFRGEKIFCALKKLLNMAQNGLDDAGFASAKLLAPFDALLENNITLSEWTKSQFGDVTAGNLNSMMKHLAPLECPDVSAS